MIKRFMNNKNKRRAFHIVTCVVVTTIIISVAIALLPKNKKIRNSDSNNKNSRGGNVNGIIGGTSVQNPTRYPFYVYFLGEAGCGGSLVAPDMVLTAGQCQFTLDIGNSAVVNAYSRYYTPNIITRTVADTILHPSYDFPYYDYMLVKLDRPVTEVEPVRINTENNFPLPDDPLRVIGLGNSGEDGGQPDVLQEADVFAVANNICQTAYASSVVDDIMICAGVPDGRRDACDGDAGSPLLNQDGVQVGIVSAGNGCGRPGFPGIYSRVSWVAEWIAETICDNSIVAPSFCSSNETLLIETHGSLLRETNGTLNSTTESTLTEIEYETFSPGSGGNQGGDYSVSSLGDSSSPGDVSVITRTEEELAILCGEDAEPTHSDSPCVRRCAVAACCFTLDPSSCIALGIDCGEYAACSIIYWGG